MSLDEDDDDLPSLSSAEAQNRADHGKQRHLENKAAAKGKLLQLKRAALRGEVSSKQLKNDEKQEQATAAAKVQVETAKSGASFVTKSAQAEAQSQVLEAQDVQTSDQLVQEAKRTEATQKAADEEYQQDLG